MMRDRIFSCDRNCGDWSLPGIMYWYSISESGFGAYMFNHSYWTSSRWIFNWLGRNSQPLWIREVVTSWNIELAFSALVSTENNWTRRPIHQACLEIKIIQFLFEILLLDGICVLYWLCMSDLTSGLIWVLCHFSIAAWLWPWLCLHSLLADARCRI